MLVDELLAATRQGGIAPGMMWPMYTAPSPAGPSNSFTLPPHTTVLKRPSQPAKLRITSRWHATVQDRILIDRQEAPKAA